MLKRLLRRLRPAPARYTAPKPDPLMQAAYDAAMAKWHEDGCPQTHHQSVYLPYDGDADRPAGWYQVSFTVAMANRTLV